MIVKAKHMPVYVRLISLYSRRSLKKHFSRVLFDCGVEMSDRPVLLIGNRFSWWDGCISYRINDLFLHKRYHIMMLEEHLRKIPFLKKAGAFSVKQGSRSVMETLSYASRLLHEKENLVVTYPQGVATSIHSRRVRFKRGTERIIAGASDRLMILFYIALTDWFSSRKPELRVRVIEYSSRERSIADLEEAYNIFLEESLVMQNPAMLLDPPC